MIKIIEKDGDFEVVGLEVEDSIWLKVGRYSLLIKQESNGVVVDAYQAGFEDRDEITTMILWDDSLEFEDETD